MQLPTLYAPWRMEYIQSLDKSGQEVCFLCQAVAAGEDKQKQREALVLWSSEHCLVVINRFPYAHGHLLVAPKAHKSDLCALSEAEGLDLYRQTTAAVELLRRAVSAQGF